MPSFNKYIIALMGISLLLFFAGFDTGSRKIIDATNIYNPECNEANMTSSGQECKVFTPEDFKLSSFFKNLFDEDAGTILLLGAAATSLVIGSFTRTSPIPFLLVASVLFFISFISDMLSIISIAEGFVRFILALILIPFSVGFMMAAIDWWRQFA